MVITVKSRLVQLRRPVSGPQRFWYGQSSGFCKEAPGYNLDSADMTPCIIVAIELNRRALDTSHLSDDRPLEVDYRYEELLTEKHGRTTKANRTRQKLKNKGVEQCLID